MIQFNLLPDIKQEFVKVNRTKRIVIIISVLASAALLLVFILLLSWDGLQKKNLSDINKDIATNKSTLTGTSDLNGILTIQNQLNSLPALYKQDPVASQLFGYLTQITPSTATISSLTINFGQDSVQISGSADSLATVNVFADILKFTTYSLSSPAGATSPTAFSNVVLSSFSVGTADTGTAYSFTFNYVPTLFSSSSVNIYVPPKTTTRSVIDQPTVLFKSAPSTNGS
jgi:hypothetical protein